MLRVTSLDPCHIFRPSLPEPVEDTAPVAATAGRRHAGSFHVYRLFLDRSGRLKAASDNALATSTWRKTSKRGIARSPVMKMVGLSVLMICLGEISAVQTASAGTVALASRTGPAGGNGGSGGYLSAGTAGTSTGSGNYANSGGAGGSQGKSGGAGQSGGGGYGMVLAALVAAALHPVLGLGVAVAAAAVQVVALPTSFCQTPITA